MYATKTEAAAIALDAHTKARGLTDNGSAQVALYHLLDSLLETCDALGLDFDAELSCLRADIVADRGSEATKHPFQYDHTSLIGVHRDARESGK
jgi:hypothetical protein